MQQYFRNLPPLDSFLKYEPRLDESIIVTPQNTIEMYNAINKIYPLEPMTDNNKFTYIKNIIDFSGYQEYLDMGTFSPTMIIYFWIKKLVLEELKRLGFDAAHIIVGGNLNIFPTTDLINYFTKSSLLYIYLPMLLENFKYKDYFTLKTEFPFVYLITRDDLPKLNVISSKNIIYELIKHLDSIMTLEDKQQYHIEEKNFLEYHEDEAFDTPELLILCTQLTAILFKYGLATAQSDIMFKNFSLNISFGPPGINANNFINSRYPKMINDLLDKCFGKNYRPLKAEYTVLYNFVLTEAGNDFNYTDWKTFYEFLIKQ